MSSNTVSQKRPASRELALFLLLFFAGIFVLPIIIYLVGSSMFGDYGDGGFSAFYGNLHGELRSGELAVWFLVFSPYLVWQLMRLTYRLFRRLGS